MIAQIAQLQSRILIMRLRNNERWNRIQTDFARLFSNTRIIVKNTRSGIIVNPGIKNYEGSEVDVAIMG